MVLEQIVDHDLVQPSWLTCWFEVHYRLEKDGMRFLRGHRTRNIEEQH